MTYPIPTCPKCDSMWIEIAVDQEIPLCDDNGIIKGFYARCIACDVEGVTKPTFHEALDAFDGGEIEG